MNKILIKKDGITLIALIITIIVLMILAGVGIRLTSGMNSSVRRSQSERKLSDLYKLQQVVLESYIKYKQNGVERVLKGIAMEYNTEAKQVADSFGVSLKSTQSYTLPKTENNDEIPGNPIYYYKLQPFHLKELGLENLGEDEFMVNYSTGEVFNITAQTNKNGEILYVYAK